MVDDTVRCPDCDALNPPGSEICQMCGKRLGAADVLAVLDLPGEIGSPPSGDGPPFAARSAGARYHAQRYHVLGYLGSASGRHRYEVADTVRALRCPNPNCKLFGMQQAGASPALCPDCATPLRPYQPIYLLQEAADQKSFGTAPEVAARGVRHPALLAPVAYFEESGTTAVRCCLLTPPNPERRWSDLEGQQDVVQVLRWGLQISRGLQTLHRHNIVFKSVDRNHLGLGEAGAALLDFEDVRVFPHTATLVTVASAGQSDFRCLASSLWQLISGSDEYDPDWPISPRVHALLAPWLEGEDSALAASEWIETLETLVIEPLAADESRPSVDLYAGRATHLGKQRTLNQDSYLVMDIAGSNVSRARAIGLYVIADGMGGHMGGEVASGMLISAIARRAQRDLLSTAVISSLTSSEIIDWLKAATKAVNLAVYEQRVREDSNMGTTLVMAVVDGVQAYIAHVGDSRAYRISADAIEPLTTDHSVVEQFVAVGQISSEAAKSHPHRGMIYKTMGGYPDIDPDIAVVTLQPNDRLLLCSDGLNGMVADDMIAQIVRSTDSPQVAAQRLIDAANDAGGEDNVTTIVVRIAPV